MYVPEGDGEIAINLEEIKYARHAGGILDLYFEGGSDQKRLTLNGTAAKQVWQAIIRIR